MIHGGMRYVLSGPKNGGSKEIKARVDALVAINPTLAGSLPAHQAPEHYVNLPRSAKGIEAAHPCPVADCCLLVFG